MSSTYFIGTYGKNSNENYYINKPIMLTGIMFSFLDDILNMSGIDVYEDFLFFFPDILVESLGLFFLPPGACVLRAP